MARFELDIKFVCEVLRVELVKKAMCVKEKKFICWEL
jgi:hypothetical protein